MGAEGVRIALCDGLGAEDGVCDCVLKIDGTWITLCDDSGYGDEMVGTNLDG